jgi:hypothetical protein
MFQRVAGETRKATSEDKGVLTHRRLHTGWIRPGNVITLFLQAKLFRVKLLTISARVVHTPTAELDDAPTVSAQSAVTRLSDPVRARRDGHRADLTYASRLIAEGSKSLAEARRIRNLH